MSFDALERWTPVDGPLWIHLHWDLPNLAELLAKPCGLSDALRDRLLDVSHRVQVEGLDQGEVLLVVRPPEVTPEHAERRVVRALVSPERCITIADLRQPALIALETRLSRGTGPRTAAMLQDLGEAVASNATLRDAELDEALADLEERLEAQRADSSDELRALRRALIAQRRFVSLCRDALVRVDLLDIDWVHDEGRSLQLVADRTGSQLKELDTLIERGRILNDELKSRQDAKTQRTLYLLTLISGVFLPLSFITGLLGVNVAGIPGRTWPGSFLILCAALVALAVGEWRALRRRELV
ncbi:hypothetical protein KRR26_04540 [Corallococcus sp. M34]|uniref:CorA family divalent cation transporter n=1 Tax=Citreicoccus inhibens TaxID=2849499 RepID=UPI001315663E|nr:CorA family divalent cation transporter [Citreicoccus inhibens]MBU8894856.1 hypothetical protein [Citreicoccus inhibens]